MTTGFCSCHVLSTYTIGVRNRLFSNGHCFNSTQSRNVERTIYVADYFGCLVTLSFQFFTLISDGLIDGWYLTAILVQIRSHRA